MAGIAALGADRFAVTLGDSTIDVEIVERLDNRVRFATDGLQRTAHHVVRDGVLHLDLGGQTIAVREMTLEVGGQSRKDASSRLLAPMNGSIVAVLGAAGDHVTKGQCIVVLEAMKMQHEIAAERDGIIESVSVKQGDQVATRQLLAVLATAAATVERPLNQEDPR
jgi:geranyl-CoA carboxylase alpha subunit